MTQHSTPPADRETQVLDALRVIIDPDLGKDIVTLGFIKNLGISSEGDVAFTVELTTPACPVKDMFKTECERVVSALPWTRKVQVAMSAQRGRSPFQAVSPGLEKVQTILAVSSCKGGVGKSTTAVNLAYTLARTGARVGLFDADVYGPSLPTLVQPESTDLYQQDELIVPLEHAGVKLMSFGWIPKQPGSEAAIMRGPMVTQVINQLLTGTGWGELDYLVLDLPPGTGDIQLTLTQIIPITAAIIVTTPQQLSFIDVVKGIQMFDKLKVPVVGVIENMSWFEPEPGGKRYHLFGRGARQKLIDLYGFRNTFEIPIVQELAETSDRGEPLALAQPDHPLAAIYDDVAGMIVREISILKHGAVERPRFSFNPERGIIIRLHDGQEYTMDPVDVRLACRGAHTVSEFTGERMLQREDIPADIFPQKFTPMGNYAISIVWSHGHPPSIYPYDYLIGLAREQARG